MITSLLILTQLLPLNGWNALFAKVCCPEYTLLEMSMEHSKLSQLLFLV